jgi:tRNA-splicing endonuclease subunit Sen15
MFANLGADKRLSESSESYDKFDRQLALAVLRNLKYQHGWDHLELTKVDSGQLLERPLIVGAPYRLLYLHPDEQRRAIREDGEDAITSQTFLERVLCMHATELLSIERLAKMFDISLIHHRSPRPDDIGSDWYHPERILLAIVHPDSNVVYYIVHQGIVKPRQN